MGQEEFEVEVLSWLSKLQRLEEPYRLDGERLEKVKGWVRRRRPFDHAYKYIARHILGLDEFKNMVALANISPFHPVHTVIVGDPSTGKSQVALSFQAITPRCVFRFGSGLTKAGARVARLGNRLMEGLLPKAHVGCAMVDEFNLLSEEDRGAFLSAMQDGCFNVEHGNLKLDYVPAKCSVIAMANPKGYFFMSRNPYMIKKQLPFEDLALLTRFHLVFVLLRPTPEEFREISTHQLEFRVKNPRSGLAFSNDEVGLWRDAVEYLRRCRARWGGKRRLKLELIAAFTGEAYRQDYRRGLAVPLSPRLNEGIANLAEAYAKAGWRFTVSVKDVLRAIRIVGLLLKDCGLDADRAFRQVNRVLKAYGEPYRFEGGEIV